MALRLKIELVSSEDFLVWLVGFFTTGSSSMLKLFWCGTYEILLHWLKGDCYITYLKIQFNLTTISSTRGVCAEV